MIENALTSSARIGRYMKVWNLLLICLATLNVTACDYINTKLYPDFRRSDEKVIVEKPPFAQNKTAKNKQPSEPSPQNKLDTAGKNEIKKIAPKNISIEKIRDIASNTTQDENFTVNPIALSPEKEIESKSSQDESLFSSSDLTTEDRFKRLEDRVQVISDTLKKMSPAITRLIGIESELDSLTFQLEALINKGQLDHLAKTNTSNQSHQSHLEQVETKPQHKITSGSTNKMHSKSLIQKIRLGDHAGKTRLVFETTQNLEYNVTIDNARKIVTVTFPDGEFTEHNLKKHANASNLVQSIENKKIGSGSEIKFKISKASKILKRFNMAPDKEVSNQRIVIDLKR